MFGRRRDIQIPPNIKQEKSKEFLGAFVKEPLLGRHGWTLTFDLTSLECMGLQQAIAVE